MRGYRRILHPAAITLLFLLHASPAITQEAGKAVAAVDVKKLSLEDLGNIEITSVSKQAESLNDAPAAIYVITNEDIRRSGATSIPEILRLAPNLQVAQSNASTYAISARGFNGTTSNKLPVLIVGRSVYTPLFSGVFSIVTKKARDTLGGLVTLGGGNIKRDGVTRYGGTFGENGAYRVYGKGFDNENSVRPDGTQIRDGWDKTQGRFRIDWAKESDVLTYQGDVFSGSQQQTLPTDNTISGQPELQGRKADGP